MSNPATNNMCLNVANTTTIATAQLWHHQFIFYVNVHKSSSRDDGEKEVIWKSEWGNWRGKQCGENTIYFWEARDRLGRIELREKELEYGCERDKRRREDDHNPENKKFSFYIISFHYEWIKESVIMLNEILHFYWVRR